MEVNIRQSVDTETEVRIKPKGLTADQKTKVANRDQTEVATLTANAKVLFENNEYNLSFALIRSALNINSKYAPALNVLARVLMKKSDWQQAIFPLLELEKQKDSFETLARLGICEYQLQNDDKALQYFDRALTLETEHSNTLFEVLKMSGNIHCRLKDYAAAEEFYHRAFTIDPKSDALLVNLGTLEIQRGDLENALLRFRSAVGLNPKNSNAWVGLALVHNEYGDFELAQGNIQTAVEISCGNRTAVHLLTSWAVKNKDFKTAILHLSNYISECEFDEEMSGLLIQFFIQEGQVSFAKMEVERLLLWNPKSIAGNQWSAELTRLGAL